MQRKYNFLNIQLFNYSLPKNFPIKKSFITPTICLKTSFNTINSFEDIRSKSSHPVYRNRARSFHLFAGLVTVSSPPENNKFPAMWPVKIEYACTGCSDSSADKATPRPVDSVMEIPSARRLITTRPVVPPASFASCRRILFKVNREISLYRIYRYNEKNRVHRIR